MNRTALYIVLLAALAGSLYFFFPGADPAAPGVDGESAGMTKPAAPASTDPAAPARPVPEGTSISVLPAPADLPTAAVTGNSVPAVPSPASGVDGPVPVPDADPGQPASPALSTAGAVPGSPGSTITDVATVAAALGIPLQDTYTPPENIVYEIEAGMRAPVALLPHDKPMSPQVAAALESIRQDFDKAVSTAPDPAAAWEDARKRADEEYKMFFGFDAYNQRAMQDALEALESRKAQP